MRKNIPLPLCFLALVIPIISGGGVFFPQTITLYIPQILVFLVLSYFAIKGELFFSFLYYPLLAFIFFSFLSIAWSVEKFASLAEAFRILACVSIFPLALSIEKEQVKWVLLSLVLSSGFIAFYGIVEYLRTLMIIGDPTWRIFATFVNPNILAGFLVALIPPTFALFLLSQKGEIVLGFILFAQMIALFLTGSRGGFLALIGASLFFIVVIVRMKMLKPFIRKGIPLLLIAATLAYFGGFVKPLGRRVAGGGTVEEVQSSAFRTLLWRSAETMIKAKPWGWGGGTFELVYPRYAIGGFSRTSHNSYLQFASEVGLQGLIALLVFLFLLAFHIHKLHQILPQNDAFILGSLLAGGLASALHSIVDYDWQITANFFTLFLLAGLSASLLDLKSKKLDKRTAVFPFLFLLFSLHLSISEHYLQVAKEVLREDPWRAKECLKLSLRFFPVRGEAKWYLGMLTFKNNEKEGLKLLKDAVRLRPYPPNFYQLGKLYLAKDDKREAEEWFRRTLEVDPHSLPALLALSKLYIEDKRTKKAEEILRKILEIEKSPFELSKPIAFFKEPAYPIAKVELAKMIMESNPQEARKLLEEAERQCEQYISTYRQWKEVMEQFTYVSEDEIRRYLDETRHLLKIFRKGGF